MTLKDLLKKCKIKFELQSMYSNLKIKADESIKGSVKTSIQKRFKTLNQDSFLKFKDFQVLPIHVQMMNKIFFDDYANGEIGIFKTMKFGLKEIELILDEMDERKIETFDGYSVYTKEQRLKGMKIYEELLILTNWIFNEILQKEDVNEIQNKKLALYLGGTYHKFWFQKLIKDTTKFSHKEIKTIIDSSRPCIGVFNSHLEIYKFLEQRESFNISSNDYDTYAMVIENKDQVLNEFEFFNIVYKNGKYDLEYKD